MTNDPELLAYEERVKGMKREKIESTLRSHDQMMVSDRWLKLQPALRDRLEVMASILRKALA